MHPKNRQIFRGPRRAQHWRLPRNCFYCWFLIVGIVDKYIPSPLSNVLISLRSNDRVAYGEAEWLFVLSSLSTILLVLSLDSLDFASAASRRIYIRVSVSIRARLWLELSHAERRLSVGMY